MSRAGLKLPAPLPPNAVALVVIALVIHDDDRHRGAVARKAPQRLRPAEQERSIANNRNHRQIRLRQLDAERSRQSPAKRAAAVAEILLVLSAKRHQLLPRAA